MNFNPMDSRLDNDSKKTAGNYRIIAHEGLIPITLKLLTRCIKQSKKQIDGVDISKVFTIARIEQIDPKTNNKLILRINDNTDIIKIVKSGSEDSDQLEINNYYQMVLMVKEDKQETVILCERMEKVRSFQEINMHILKVIAARIQRKNIRNRG